MTFAKYTKFVIIFLIVLLSIIVTGCNTNTASEIEVFEKKRELLELSFDSFDFDSETESIQVVFSTNLPIGTEIHSITIMESGKFNIVDLLEGFYILEDSPVTLEIPISDIDFQADEEYIIEIYFKVDFDKEINKNFLYDTVFGGLSREMVDAYSDSNLVSVKENGYASYTVYLKSKNKLTLPIGLLKANEKTVEEIEDKVDEVMEDKLSEDFLQFNKEYYGFFKNYLDLIAGNFELMTDGYYSSNLIDDLIMYTNEFNEYLDVYNQDATPTNDVDEVLYKITNEMISNQREVNSYIIKGIENSDDNSLFIAGEYTQTVVDLYLEGYAQLK